MGKDEARMTHGLKPFYMWKVNWSTWQERGKKIKSESPTRIEPMTSRTLGERSIHWAMRTHREQGKSPSPGALRVNPFWWKVIYRKFPQKICHALMRNNQSTNQSAAQSCSFKCTFLCSEGPLTKMAESVRGNLSESWNNVFSRESPF